MSSSRHASSHPVPQRLGTDNDPSQLTVFGPLPADVEIPKEESFIGRVLKRVTSSASTAHLWQKAGPRDEPTSSSPRLSVELAGKSGNFSGRNSSAGVEDEIRRAVTEEAEICDVDDCPRNLAMVLERIKLIASKSSSHEILPYRDTDFKQFWVPDSSSTECYECGEKFTTFRRRRHCRICGQLFCGRCANQEIPGRVLGYSGSLRVCSFCSQVVLSYARFADPDEARAVHQTPNSWPTPPQVTLSADRDYLDALQNRPHYTPRRIVGSAVSGSSMENRYQFFSGQAGADTEDQPLLAQASTSKDAPSLTFEQLREIWLEMNHITNGLELRIHRHRFRAFPDCVTGSEIVDWLIRRKKASNRKQAARVGQGLLSFKFLDCLTGTDSAFADEYVLYKPKTVTNELEDAVILSSTEIDQEEPTWLQEIQHAQADSAGAQSEEGRHSRLDGLFDGAGSPDVDEIFIKEFGSRMTKKYMARSDSVVSLSSQTPGSLSGTVSLTDDAGLGHHHHEMDHSPPVSPTVSHAPSVQVPEEVAFGNVPELEFWRTPESAEMKIDVMENDHVLQALNSAFQHRLHALLRQLQDWEQISQEWHEPIMTLASKVTENVLPSVKENRDDMDIRHYVHIKKIPGGRTSDSKVVFGVVCTKHVAHRKMRQNFVNPKILLYGPPLEFQRADNRFSSLEPILQQEAEFLKDYVTKICDFRPDIVIAERNVSRLAQDYLFEENVTLAANMKESVMKRLSRSTGGEKFAFADGRFVKPKLGTCAKFDVKTIALPDGSSKSYMTFDGCLKNSGCTILIRGDTAETLQKVKRILRFVVYCQYNWRLERALLMDQHAQPPEGTDCPAVATSENLDFREYLETYVSSVSPFILPSLPYMKWDSAQRNLLKERYNLPKVVFWSKVLEASAKNGETAGVGHENGGMDSTDVGRISNGELNIAENDSSPPGPLAPQVKRSHPLHPLQEMRLSSGVSDPAVQRALINYRAYGGGKRQVPYYHADQFYQNYRSESPSKKPTGRQLVDCFDVYKHQRLPILLSIHAYETAELNASFCVSPWILLIEFYGKNDLTLGDYLETFCFRPDAPCPNQLCHRSIREHCRRFACGNAVVSVVLKELGSAGSAPVTKLVTWTWCRICGEAGPVVPLSSQAWSLSFAKYLDLRFHAGTYRRTGTSTCQHSLHCDHIQFFAYDHTVAAFRWNPIVVREICSPSLIIDISDRKGLPSRACLIEMVKLCAIRGHNVYAVISEHLSSCQELEIEKLAERLHLLGEASRTEKQLFKDRLECLQVKLASPLLKFEALSESEWDQQRDFVWDIEDTLVNLKRKITEAAIVWSGHLGELDAAKRKEERRHINIKAFQSTPEFPREDTLTALSSTPFSSESYTEPFSDDMRIKIELGGEETDEEDNGLSMHSGPMRSRGDSNDSQRGLLHSATTAAGMHSMVTDFSTEVAAFHSTKTPVSGTSRQKSISGGGTNAVPLPFPPNEHYIISENDKIPVVIYDEELSSVIAYALSSNDYAVQLSELRRNAKRESKDAGSSCVSERNPSGTSGLNYSPHSLDSAAAKPRNPALAFLQNAAEGSPLYHVEPLSGSTTAGDVENHSCEPSVHFAEPAPKGASKSKSAMKATPDPKQQIIEIQFSDPTSKFYCRIYFPEEFHQLRSVIFPYGEDRFIRSLAHSVAWKAGGGKSGSTFSKTTDGRFVLKQMSRLEVQSFLEFAPQYFAYVLNGVKDKKPTVMARVVGVYRIGFRNSQTGTSTKQDLLVMENLFYGRKIQQVYDLKGSLRNRLATTDAKAKSDLEMAGAELVLLDENFLKGICENPLYIRPQAKVFLDTALKADTQFLASVFVMDYSLLVGIDDSKDSQEIVVGIIDYIRTFTWDKRLEMVVKSSGLLGGQGKLPTIVSPELYQSRFVEAMKRYFLPVPDQWYGLARFMPDA